MKRIYWYELPGNKFLKKLEPAMLSELGCVVIQEIKVIGKKRNESREPVRVFYDSDYVVQRLNVDLIQPLQIESLEQLQSLVSQAWYLSYLLKIRQPS